MHRSVRAAAWFCRRLMGYLPHCNTLAASLYLLSVPWALFSSCPHCLPLLLGTPLAKPPPCSQYDL